MLNEINLKNTLKKQAKTICFTIGAFYSIIGTFMILMVMLQSFMISNFHSDVPENFLKTLSLLYNLVTTHMPFMILVGLSYVAFGWFYEELKGKRLRINLILSALSLIWVITYGINGRDYIELFIAGLPKNKFFTNITYVLMGLGYIAVLALFTIPQYVIGKKIKNQEPEKTNLNS